MSQKGTAYQRPAPPELAANRSEYWGTGSNSNNCRSNNDVSRRSYREQECFPHQPQGPRGLRVRERPQSAGCHPVSPPSSRAPTNIAVQSCTRNRAGIVRGGGRDGRAAPPPTPPPPRFPSSPGVAASPSEFQRNQGQQPAAPPDNVCRRRPSTAEPKRSQTVVAAEDVGYEHYRHFDHAPTRGAPAEDAPAGVAIAIPPGFGDVGYSSGDTHCAEFRHSSRNGAGHVACPPRPPAGNTFSCQGHSLHSRAAHHGDVSQAARHEESETAGATFPPRHVRSPSLNRSIVYRRSSRGERGAAAEVTGLRRRPASAAPPRSRAADTYGRFRTGTRGVESSSSSDSTESGFGRDLAVEPSRGRLNVRAGGRGMQRPRSASATAGRRACTSDVGEFAPTAGGGARPPPFAARPRAQSASIPAAVVPSFVVSEKQVLRFFGHLTEGEIPASRLPRLLRSSPPSKYIRYATCVIYLRACSPCLTPWASATVELDWGGGRSAQEERAGELSSPILKIRQVVLHLYLADGSLEIFEKRQVLVELVKRACLLWSSVHTAFA